MLVGPRIVINLQRLVHLRSKGVGPSERRAGGGVIELFVVPCCYSPHRRGCSNGERLLYGEGESSFSLFLPASSVNSPLYFPGVAVPHLCDSPSPSHTLTVSLLLLPHFNLYSFCYPAVALTVPLFFRFRPLLVLLQTEQFVHTLKDELVKSALLALHAARPGYVSKSQRQSAVQGHHQGHIGTDGEQNQIPGQSPATPEPTATCNNVEGCQTPTGEEAELGKTKNQDSIPHHKEYDEEEWVNLTTLLGCSAPVFVSKDFSCSPFTI